ncbi:hypothetical protein [Powai lake megavirus]|uniref:Uncharacterized protein n=1 Tax=Powai lake megavirus TaxID=1842663 RepID=A0A167R7N5_9VIRU|nr:hypothetical protein QJ849_gp233 [Powai lake megavirus]ANB50395.1 hypothetical protein [Powai lake megavirus]WBF70984.1 hypothetical protein [Megavirus caiporensis]
MSNIINNTNNNQNNEIDFDEEIEKKAFIIEDDEFVFPKATIDAKLSKLQHDVTEFITSVILKHEREFYELVLNNGKDNIKQILCNTQSIIINFIQLATNKFYNNIYQDIQNKNNTDIANLIIEMSEYADYGPHILLDKLVRLTISIHLDINREQLVLNNFCYDIYEKSLLTQINICILSYNLLHMLSKAPNEDIPFVNIPEGQNAFDIIIDKNIGV